MSEITIQSPNSESVKESFIFTLYDSKGQKIKFGSIIDNFQSGVEKIVVIFIRHFFCGSCQAYASQLAQVKDEALANAKVKLVLIGCGDYQPIKAYAELTGFRGAIYADPTRALFKHFGLVEHLQTTPANETKKSYATTYTPIGNALSSIWNGPLKHPSHIGKQGNISQLGGDFIFGPDGQCLFASRMRHTEDHVEVVDLMKEAGVDYHV